MWGNPWGFESSPSAPSLPSGIVIVLRSNYFLVTRAGRPISVRGSLWHNGPVGPRTERACHDVALTSGDPARRIRSRARKPAWLKVRAPGGPNYMRLKRLPARVESPHGLRGGALPEHRRVLGGRDRDLHDPRRRVHAELRLLRGAHGRPVWEDREEPERIGRAVGDLGSSTS